MPKLSPLDLLLEQILKVEESSVRNLVQHFAKNNPFDDASNENMQEKLLNEYVLRKVSIATVDQKISEASFEFNGLSQSISNHENYLRDLLVIEELKARLEETECALQKNKNEINVTKKHIDKLENHANEKQEAERNQTVVIEKGNSCIQKATVLGETTKKTYLLSQIVNELNQQFDDLKKFKALETKKMDMLSEIEHDQRYKQFLEEIGEHYDRMMRSNFWEQLNVAVKTAKPIQINTIFNDHEWSSVDLCQKLGEDAMKKFKTIIADIDKEFMKECSHANSSGKHDIQKSVKERSRKISEAEEQLITYMKMIAEAWMIEQETENFKNDRIRITEESPEREKKFLGLIEQTATREAPHGMEPYLARVEEAFRKFLVMRKALDPKLDVKLVNRQEKISQEEIEKHSSRQMFAQEKAREALLRDLNSILEVWLEDKQKEKASQETMKEKKRQNDILLAKQMIKYVSRQNQVHEMGLERLPQLEEMLIECENQSVLMDETLRTSREKLQALVDEYNEITSNNGSRSQSLNLEDVLSTENREMQKIIDRLTELLIVQEKAVASLKEALKENQLFFNKAFKTQDHMSSLKKEAYITELKKLNELESTQKELNLQLNEIRTTLKEKIDGAEIASLEQGKLSDERVELIEKKLQTHAKKLSLEEDRKQENKKLNLIKGFMEIAIGKNKDHLAVIQTLYCLCPSEVLIEFLDDTAIPHLLVSRLSDHKNLRVFLVAAKEFLHHYQQKEDKCLSDDGIKQTLGSLQKDNIVLKNFSKILAKLIFVSLHLSSKLDESLSKVNEEESKEMEGSNGRIGASEKERFFFQHPSGSGQMCRHLEKIMLVVNELAKVLQDLKENKILNYKQHKMNVLTITEGLNLLNKVEKALEKLVSSIKSDRTLKAEVMPGVKFF